MTTALQSSQASQAAYARWSQGQTLGAKYGALAGYKVDAVFGNPSKAGLQGYAFTNGKGHTIVAFAGTNDAMDVYDNIANLGYAQWEQTKGTVDKYLNGLSNGSQVTFTGHSLGGALAQYAAYDMLKSGRLSAPEVKLDTFNALGGLHGLSENGTYDAKILSGLASRHYVNAEDVITWLSPHLPGEILVVPDQRPGLPDGFLGAHALDQFDEDALGAVSRGGIPYLDSDTLVKQPELLAELAFRAYKLKANPNPTNLYQFVDALADFPLSELPDVALWATLVIGGLEWDGLNWVGDALRDALDKLEDFLPRFGSDLTTIVSRLFGQSLQPLRDPLILDLGEEGVALKSMAESGVYFDMDGDGVKERTGWLTKEDGFLVIDENGNGKIDDISELIGDQNRSGFAELAAHDSNNDGVINSKDPVWKQLKVWIDKNENGVTDRGELVSLASVKVKEIDLDYTEVTFTASENRIHEQGNYTTTDGATRQLIDVWMQTDNVNTLGAQASVSSAAAALPALRGYGALADLQQAASRDSTLRSQLQKIAATKPEDLDDFNAGVEKLLIRWAKADQIAPDSRGAFIDARHLAVVEAYTGTPWVLPNTNPPVVNPDAARATSLRSAYDQILTDLTGALAIQGPLAEGFKGVVYSVNMDSFASALPLDRHAKALSEIAPADAAEQFYFWRLSKLALERLGKNLGMEAREIAPIFAEALKDTGLAPHVQLFNKILDQSAAAKPNLKLSGGQIHVLGAQDDDATINGAGVVFGGNGDDRLVQTSSASASLYGQNGNDALFGGAGADHLDGGAGADWMVGGAGNDTYVVDSASDIVIEERSAGVDSVRSSISYRLGANLENLILLGAADIDGTGNDLANRLEGNAGRNTLAGGLGDDVYYIDGKDKVVEIENGGRDTIYVDASYVLSAHVEILHLTGTGHYNGTGNDLNNTIYGNAGNNVLNGGAGGDRLYGGLGDDVFHIDNAADLVYENPGEGVDTVYSSVNIANIANVEIFRATGTADVSMQGSRLAETFYGNDGRNSINGGGGGDVLRGGKGDDTYAVHDAADRIIEAKDQGIDLVQTRLSSYRLGSNLENLVYQGSEAFTGVGNDENNRIEGGNRNDVLNGGNGDDELHGKNGDDKLSGGAGHDRLLGGAGADRLEGGAGDDYLDGGLGADIMIGGAGNDTYMIDDPNDRVVEAANGGVDTMIVKTSIIMPTAIENVTLMEGGAYDVNGNAQSNVIIGNDSNNVLDGRGGADRMEGRRGNDTYIVDNAGDRVIEAVNSGTDHIKSSVDLLLPENVENLTLTGNAIRAAGNALNNVIIGNARNNVIFGGGGADTLTGGAGKDRFVFNRVDGSAFDTITDMELGASGDQIDLSKLLRSIGYAGANPLGDKVLRIVNTSGHASIEVNSEWEAGKEKWARIILVQKVSAADLAASSNLIFDSKTNQRPFILNEIEDRSLVVNEQFSLIVPTIAGDYDGDKLTWTARIVGADGKLAALPSWLSFNKYVPALVGAPEVGASDVVVRLTARDEDGGTVSTDFELKIAIPNPAPPANDMIRGGGGDDKLYGYEGDDVLIGGPGEDRLDGGAGTDRASYAEAAAAVTANLANAKLNKGEAAGDVYVSIENLQGSKFHDQLSGDAKANAVWGGAGDDTILGLAGNDTLYGEAGNDVLEGGAGKDTLYGGAGRDVFVFRSASETGATASTADVVMDFTRGQDRMDLAGFDADALLAGQQKFTGLIAASAAFTKAGQLRFDAKAGVLYGNTDGDAAAEFAIKLQGLAALSNDDFIF